MNYDEELMENSPSLMYDSSWVGTPGVNLLGFSKHFPGTGTSDIAITRTNQQNIISQYGIIAEVSFVIKDDLSGKGLTYYPIEFSISNVKAIDKNETELEVQTMTTTSIIEFNPVSVNEIQDENQIKIYPNPAIEKINIQSGKQLEKVYLFDLYGRLIFESILQTNETQINTDHLPAGYYMLKVQTKDKTEWLKVNVGR